MASVTHDKKTGRRTIQFVGADGKRRSIRLGKVSAKQAESAKLHLEDLIACKATGTASKGTTAGWVADLPDTLRRRLERVGLVRPREGTESPALAEWLQTYVTSRRDVKDTTATVYSHTRRNLLAFFGGDRRMNSITPGDADAFRVFLKVEEGLAENTVRRRMGIAKQFFRAAIRRKLIAENPFDGQSTLVRENPKRFYFVSREQSQNVLDACPDARWRLVFALCRYGGLRCPSELTRLKWEDVNWEKMRFAVHASKTEHHADAGVRMVPIFPELYPHLRDAFEQAAPGTVYCCPQYSNPHQMYRKAMVKIIKQAGLRLWPRLFQNCRSSRETELAEQYPVQVICAWIGNSPQVAAKHYLQVTEEHFEKAVQNPVQQASARARTDSQRCRGETTNAPFCSPVRTDATPCVDKELCPLGLVGLEPTTNKL